MEFAFLCFGIKASLAEILEYFFHIPVMLGHVIQVDEYIIQRVYRANQRLSTLFQVDFEVIRTMRRESFSFSFAENVSKFVILRRDIGEIRSFCKFCGVGLNV